MGSRMKATIMVLLIGALSGSASVATAEENCAVHPRNLRPVAVTHTMPPYPIIETKVGMGTARLLVMVGADGRC